jgi:hypothetical protein
MLQILIMHGIEWLTKLDLTIRATDLDMLSQLMVQEATMTSEMVNMMTKDVDTISLSTQELKMHLLT